MRISLNKPMEAVANTDTLEGLELMQEYEKSLLQNFECADIPAENATHDGIMLRQVNMPAGSFVSGHEHRGSHWNIVMTGKAIVSINGESSKVQAGDVFVSNPNARKGLYIIEDMTWITVHHNPKNLTDNDEIEKEFVTKSESYYDMKNQLEGGNECLSE